MKKRGIKPRLNQYAKKDFYLITTFLVVFVPEAFISIK